MDVLKMLADLRQEREQIEEAIVTLERLARGRGKPPRPSAGLDDVRLNGAAVRRAARIRSKRPPRLKFPHTKCARGALRRSLYTCIECPPRN